MNSIILDQIAPFNKCSPHFWFHKLEHIFAAEGVTRSKHKFQYAEHKIGPTIMHCVQKILDCKMNVKYDYEMLKLEVLRYCKRNSLQQFRCFEYQLILQLKLQLSSRTDWTPRKLIDKMREIVGDKLSEDLLHILFVWYLPNKVTSRLTPLDIEGPELERIVDLLYYDGKISENEILHPASTNITPQSILAHADAVTQSLPREQVSCEVKQLGQQVKQVCNVPPAISENNDQITCELKQVKLDDSVTPLELAELKAVAAELKRITSLSEEEQLVELRKRILDQPSNSVTRANATSQCHIGDLPPHRQEVSTVSANNLSSTSTPSTSLPSRQSHVAQIKAAIGKISEAQSLIIPLQIATEQGELGNSIDECVRNNLSVLLRRLQDLSNYILYEARAIKYPNYSTDESADDSDVE